MALTHLGRYRILGELGRGAMGVVYRAVDPLIEREVALKTLHNELPADVIDEVRARFLREARSAGRLNHPNIVTIFDVGQEGSAAYIAMELLEGPSLHQMLKERQPIPFHSAADIIAQVADALHHAHQFSIVHRDVKPGNVVVVSRTGRAKLTDFGVAYVPASDVTQNGSALGSPRYMAPEQVLGQPVDARTDIFSLGVVLYELLTRRTPFVWPGDTTVYALMQRIAGEPHPPLRQIDPEIPAGFDRIMDRALAKRPQDRYQSASEFASDLRNYHSLGGGTEFAKTVPQAILQPQAAAEAQQMRNQLIDDLNQFAKDFEAQEKQRLRAEEAARLKKEQSLHEWGAAEQKKREAFERGEPVARESDPTSMSTTRRMAAVEILRQQAAFRKAQEEAKPKAMAALDAAMRAALQYLIEFGKEMNAHEPHAGASYEFVYVGKLQSVTLCQAALSKRTLKLPEGNELCAQIGLRFWVRPAEPPKFMLLGEDVRRCEQYLKSLGVEFQQRSRSSDGERPVQFVVTGPLPCDVNIRADYEAATATVELINVRRFGRVTVRLATEAFKNAIDDLARYVLGVDNDFRKLIPDA